MIAAVLRKASESRDKLFRGLTFLFRHKWGSIRLDINVVTQMALFGGFEPLNVPVHSTATRCPTGLITDQAQTSHLPSSIIVSYISYSPKLWELMKRYERWEADEESDKCIYHWPHH